MTGIIKETQIGAPGDFMEEVTFSQTLEHGHVTDCGLTVGRLPPVGWLLRAPLSHGNLTVSSLLNLQEILNKAWTLCLKAMGLSLTDSTS